ncbi:bifunctional glycoside hydrolase 114/ polysaccharide deacetylase family protein [Caballeronia sp. LZ016]|uniref:bifunctional glycoside hydrolase 114/ polysaccharide deacetylase family protein n=1 Tax=Caballeronia sp. LZ016 TaxID=3038554 RepID=UPI0028556749|nr:bifunctional glycoside hydrolase 114/ polysaccharide deacetylase family protein [Caballeronia sp. LZ016]MDR5740486.1 bifunctional glycoside hydrolase 114/ polysaccharide deacetylase family protein [Caballeronia sp. LZ016]
MLALSRGIGRTLATMLAAALAMTLLPASADEGARDPSIALFYGSPVPVGQLSSFDAVVVEPDSGFSPSTHAASSAQSRWLAYVSVGEVTPARAYYKDMPPAWLKGSNAAWASRIVDQTAPGWPQFFVDRVIAPLWARGYRGFFLDTLDSYQAIARNDEERAQQEAGVVAVIRAIKARYPDARLIFNRGFELMPRVHDLAYAVAFESLYRGWDQANRRYVAVPEADRQWLLAQARTLRERYALPVLSIDYCPPSDRECARDAIDKIRQQGLIPYVTDGALQTVGSGIPSRPDASASRTILVVQDVQPGANLNVTPGVRFVSMPLNWLGYRVEFADVAKPLPEGDLSKRYAGVVVWLDYPAPDPSAFRDWLEAQVDHRTPVAMLTTFGIDMSGELARKLDLEPVAGRPGKRLRVESMDASMMGFEMQPQPDPHDTANVRAGARSRSLLRLASADAGNDFAIDAAAITPWGGYAMRPFAVFDMPMANQARWVLQPIRFFRAALRLPDDMPAPDPTTENGRRLLMTHIDGDGLASRAEFDVNGGPMKVSTNAPPQYSGDALYNVIRKFGLPTTVSVIEGEISDDGPYSKDAPRLRAIARELFALPNVEMASHTYTHPLQWMRVTGLGKSSGDDTAEGGGRANYNGLSIDIPGYRYDTDREIGGSIRYIDTLAPPAKRVKVLLWSGDCQVPASVIEAADKAGVYNMNGGDTLITKRYPSWTAIAPLGVNKDGYFQVFAPNQNEEPYTDLWHGPYYGYRRVLETFDMTETPIRFKPVDVYYHMFSGTKYASVKTLSEVYRTLSAQPLMPVYASEYAQKVLDFQRMEVTRDGDFWRIRGNGSLRTVRLPDDRVPDLASAEGVIGFKAGPGGVYVSLSGGEARFRIVDAAQAAKMPYLAEANGVVDRFTRTAQGFVFELTSHVAPHFAIGGEARAGACVVRANGRALLPAIAQGRRVYSPPASKRNESDAVHVDVVCAS